MHRLLGRQSDLLHRVRGLRLLFYAAFGSGLGSWMAFVALNLDVWDRTHSGSWIAALLIADFLPAIAIGLTVGPLVDRLSRRRVMVSADVVRFLVFCTLPFAASAGQIVALAAVAGLADGLLPAGRLRGPAEPRRGSRAAERAGPAPGGRRSDDRRRPADRRRARRRDEPGLGVRGERDHVPPLGGCSSSASRSTCSRSPRRAREGHWRDIAAGLRLIGSSRALLTVLVAWNVGMLGNAGVNVGEVVLAKVSFGAGDFGYGLLLATAGFGLVFGSLSAGAWLERRDLPRVYAGGFVLDGDRDRPRRGVAERLVRRRLRHRLGRRQRGRRSSVTPCSFSAGRPTRCADACSRC